MNSAYIMMLGIIPGAALMLAALNKYEGLFEDHRAFSAFAIGLVGGAFMGMFHMLLDDWSLGMHGPDIITSLIVFVFLFALVQMMMLVVLLNRKGIRQKQDAVFSGIALGSGAGSFVIVFLNFRILLGAQPSPGITEIVTIFMLSAGHAFLFTAAGIFAGLFAYTQDRENITTGVGFFVVHSLAILPFRWFVLSSISGTASLVLSTILAAGLFLYAYGFVDGSLSSETERARRRQVRKEKLSTRG